MTQRNNLEHGCMDAQSHFLFTFMNFLWGKQLFDTVHSVHNNVHTLISSKSVSPVPIHTKWVQGF